MNIQARQKKPRPGDGAAAPDQPARDPSAPIHSTLTGESVPVIRSAEDGDAPAAAGECAAW
jgi:hypothetical protein